MFGFKYHVELSTRPENSIGTDEMWEQATDGLQGALDDLGVEYVVNEGDGAFYGPKIDFHLEDSIGRTWQCGTIQLDMNLPERFDLSYIGPDGEKHRPVMIHRVVFGSIERFIGILTEHFAGAFPLWLAPVQAKILTITDRADEAALKLQKALTIKGHYAGRLSGHYGDLTKEAVASFQKSKGLSADGIAGKKTIKALFGEEAANAKAEEEKKTYKTEKLNWFHGGNGNIPNGATITIKDVATGKTFKAKRRFGTNHMDAEPVDAEATKAMKAIFGGSWSWSRRAVLVLYNGHVYAGSMNGMPHAEEDENITNNDFDGVFCLHFYGSKTHGSDKVDKEHQNQVAKAMKATW